MNEEQKGLYFGSWNDSDIRLYQDSQEVGTAQAISILSSENGIEGGMIISTMQEGIEGVVNVEIHAFGSCGSLQVLYLGNVQLEGQKLFTVNRYQAKELTKWGGGVDLNNGF